MFFRSKSRPIRIISILDGDDSLGVYLRRRYLIDAWSGALKVESTRVSLFGRIMGTGEEFVIQISGGTDG